MGGKVSTPPRGKVSSTIPVSITSQANVYEFVTKNINNAFSTLKDTQNYMGSNCYSLLHTLTQAQIKSDEMSGTDSKITPVLHAGITKISDVFPGNYYKMFQIVLNETKTYETDLPEKIRELLEKKQFWIRNPSEVINKIIIGFPGVRDMVAQGTIKQAKTIREECPSRSAGGADTTSKCMGDIFNGASHAQKERCCICGLGEPPPLIDIEHVVSSQLLILLGICPATKSWAGFWEVFNALVTSGGGGNNWVTQLIRFFPEGKERDRARRVFRSMMLPAHSNCNRNIKRELSPIGISMSMEGKVRIGDITADINKKFTDNMDGMSYVERVIEPSINAINSDLKKSKLSPSNLVNYKKEWVKNQIVVFNEIAWLLNSIDQRNNRASLGLIQFLYVSAEESPLDGDKDAFIELVSDLLDFKKGVINSGNIKSLIFTNQQTQLIIMTKLTLVVEALLVEFQAEVQTPVKEHTHDYSSDSEYYGSPDTAMTTGSVTGSPFDTEFYDNLSPAGNKDQKRRPISTTLIPYGSDDYGALQDKIVSDLLGEDTTLYAESAGMEDMHSGEDTTSYAESAGMVYGNELMNRVGARPKTKKNTDINMRNQVIKDIANRAVRNTYGTAKLRTASEAQLTAVARNAAYGVLIHQELHNNQIPRNARRSALEAAMSALRHQNNDSSFSPELGFTPELGGGTRKRKYTTTRRRSTHKRRPSKKPHRTIRRQRRNKKGTQKRRK